MILRRCVTATSVVLLLIETSCMHVETNTSIKSSRVVSEKTQKNIQGDWQYDTVMDARMVSDGHAVISGQVDRYRDCQLVTTTTTEDTIAWERHPSDTGWVWGLGLVGLAGAGSLAWGLDRHAHGEPFSRSEGSDSSEKLTNVGAAVYFGGALSLLLVEAVVTGFRSIDTETTQIKENYSTKQDRCDRAPAAGAAVALKS
jgi:hypothetical protein